MKRVRAQSAATACSSSRSSRRWSSTACKDLLAGRRPGGLWRQQTTPSPPSREAPRAAAGRKGCERSISRAAASGAARPRRSRITSIGSTRRLPSVEAATEPHGAAAGALRRRVRSALVIGTRWTTISAVDELTAIRFDPSRHTAGRRDAAWPAPAAVATAVRRRFVSSRRRRAVRAAGRGGGCRPAPPPAERTVLALRRRWHAARAGRCGGAAGLAAVADRAPPIAVAHGATAAARCAAADAVAPSSAAPVAAGPSRCRRSRRRSRAALGRAGAHDRAIDGWVRRAFPIGRSMRSCTA